MSITKADIVAAREAAGSIPKEAALFGDPAKQEQVARLAAEIKRMQTPAYINKLSAQSFQGLAGEELEAARKKLAIAEGRKMTDLFAMYEDATKGASTGGMLDRYSASAGGLGAAVGALLGGLLGGGKGALIGGILGGIGLYAAQKMGLGGDALQKFFKGSVDKVLGPTGETVGEEEKAVMIQNLVDNTTKAAITQKKSNSEFDAAVTGNYTEQDPNVLTEPEVPMSPAGPVSTAPLALPPPEAKPEPAQTYGDELYNKAITPQTTPPTEPVSPVVSVPAPAPVATVPPEVVPPKVAAMRKKNVAAGKEEQGISQEVKDWRDDTSRAGVTAAEIGKGIGNRAVDLVTAPVEVARMLGKKTRDVAGDAGNALKTILGGRPK